MTGYLGSVADQAQRSMVPLPELGATGVLWSDGVVVTAARDEGIRGARISGPQLPIAAIDLSGENGGTAAPRADSSVRPGEWIVAVWRNGVERAFEAGSVAGTASVMCGEQPVREVLTSIALVRAMAGAGIFDVDGRLLAMIVPCDEGLTAVSAADIDAMLDAGRTNEGRVLAAFGLRLGRLTVDEAAHFKVPQGVVVREVWEGYPAARSGLRPGDVVHAVDDRAATMPEEVQTLLLDGTAPSVAVAVQRLATTMTIAIARGEAETAPAEEPPAGIVWETPRGGYPVEAVRPDSPAARAGIQPGDVVLRIDHVQPRNLTEVQRRLAGSRSATFLELQRGRRRWGVLLS
jgi:membrane-associated protease RseP (regulator of RpoE activity)